MVWVAATLQICRPEEGELNALAKEEMYGNIERAKVGGGFIADEDDSESSEEGSSV